MIFDLRNRQTVACKTAAVRRVPRASKDPDVILSHSDRYVAVLSFVNTAVGEQFIGAFDTREQAEQAAQLAVQQYNRLTINRPQNSKNSSRNK